MTFPSHQQYKDTRSGWPRQIPASWEFTPIKRLASMIYGDALPSENRNEAGSIPVYGSNGAFAQHGVANTSAPVILIGRKGSCGALNWSEIPAFAIDTVYFVDDDHAICNLRWLYWALHFADLDNLSQDTGVPGLSREIAYQIRLPHPPLSEQIAIATFLDRETSKIDALVAEQQRLIELLKEKRQTVISHAVTKGRDPNAPMKDSGVEWLGDVPTHWEICSLGRITRSKCDGPFGSGLKSSHYTEKGIRVVRLQNIRPDQFDESDSVFIDEVYYRTALGDHDVYAGDVLIAGLGDDRNTVGRACVAPVGIEPAMVKADCFRFRLEHTRVVPHFIAMQLTAGASYDAGMLSSGSTRSRISLSISATRKIAIPPISEQREIVHWLEDQICCFDLLRDEAESAVILLRERRAALISAAITGKIDVRGAVTTAKCSISRERVRMIIAASLIERLSAKANFGRVKLQKLVYLAEVHANLRELEGHYLREAAGPLDRDMLSEMEKQLQAAGHISVDQPGGRGGQVIYKIVGHSGAYRNELISLLDDRQQKFSRLIVDLEDLETKSVEAIATLFAVWNDALIEGRKPDDDTIVSEMLTNWHPEKAKKFKASELRGWLSWMRRHSLVPEGNGPKTRTGRLFS